MSDNWKPEEVADWAMMATRKKGSKRKTEPCGCRSVTYVDSKGVSTVEKDYCMLHGAEG